MNNETLTHLAELLYTMQQVVLADAQQNGGANPERVYGKLVAVHWGAIRQATGLAGKWASLEDTKAALKAKLSGGMSGSGAGVSPSGALDFDLGAWDPAAGMCDVCGASEARGPSGECVICGAS